MEASAEGRIQGVVLLAHGERVYQVRAAAAMVHVCARDLPSSKAVEKGDQGIIRGLHVPTGRVGATEIRGAAGRVWDLMDVHLVDAWTGSQQIPDLFVVDFQNAHVHRPSLPLFQRRENRVHSTGDHAPVRLLADDSVCLPRACLTVRDHGSIISVEHRLADFRDGLVVNGLLGRVWPEGVIAPIDRLRPFPAIALAVSVRVGWPQTDAVRTFREDAHLMARSGPQSHTDRNVALRTIKRQCGCYRNGASLSHGRRRPTALELQELLRWLQARHRRRPHAVALHA
mmetsp:Transcript_76878/g.213578  ORF Transcript_76878/g.213578 Transcript_76878/m.213578 type:complete len:285 (+) Transcript_76878:1173-2027(+)